MMERVMDELKLMPKFYDELSDEALDRIDGPGALCLQCGASQACAGYRTEEMSDEFSDQPLDRVDGRILPTWLCRGA